MAYGVSSFIILLAAGFSLLMGTLTRETRYYYLYDPNVDQLALLLLDRSFDKIFIDISGHHFRQIQINCNSRYLYSRLKMLDSGHAKTSFDYFQWPNERLDPCYKVIVVEWPRLAHIILLLLNFQPCFKRCIYGRKVGEKPELVLLNLDLELESVLRFMTGKEYSKYSEVLNSYIGKRVQKEIFSNENLDNG